MPPPHPADMTNVGPGAFLPIRAFFPTHGCYFPHSTGLKTEIFTFAVPLVPEKNLHNTCERSAKARAPIAGTLIIIKNR